MSPIHVVAAVIYDDLGRVLLTKRGEETHQGGLWEFPGGKLEADETVADGLRRELKEELGIDLLRHRPLIRIPHQYPDKSILLDVYLVTDYLGVPLGLEGQPLQWVEPQSLSDYPMPAADLPVVTAVNLPDRYLITGPDPRSPEQFLDRLQQALERGVRLVQLRVGDLPEPDLLELGRRALSLSHANNARMLLNGSHELAVEMGADGVHLNSTRLKLLSSRPLPDDMLVAASCHTPAELSHASVSGVDFVVLSPVKKTNTHPEVLPLGWERFATMIGGATVPVYALGGMEESDINKAWQCGAQGIAGIGCFWG